MWDKWNLRVLRTLPVSLVDFRVGIVSNCNAQRERCLKMHGRLGSVGGCHLVFRLGYSGLHSKFGPIGELARCLLH
jgi:hypothetical protein